MNRRLKGQDDRHQSSPLMFATTVPSGQSDKQPVSSRKPRQACPPAWIVVHALGSPPTEQPVWHSPWHGVHDLPESPTNPAGHSNTQAPLCRLYLQLGQLSAPALLQVLQSGLQFEQPPTAASKKNPMSQTHMDDPDTAMAVGHAGRHSPVGAASVGATTLRHPPSGPLHSSAPGPRQPRAHSRWQG